MEEHLSVDLSSEDPTFVLASKCDKHAPFCSWHQIRGAALRVTAGGALHADHLYTTIKLHLVASTSQVPLIHNAIRSTICETARVLCIDCAMFGFVRRSILCSSEPDLVALW
jgi:hypothetical protein